jgi:hypothetical protein
MKSRWALATAWVRQSRVKQETSTHAMHRVAVVSAVPGTDVPDAACAAFGGTAVATDEVIAIGPILRVAENAFSNSADPA